MKKLLLFCAFVVLVSCRQKINEADCLKFHTGKFRYLDDAFTGVVVERNDSVQKETKKSENRYFEGHIKWLSDCEYVLILYKAKAKYGEEMLNKPLHTTIEEVNGNVATVKFVHNGTEGILKMEKIE